MADISDLTRSTLDNGLEVLLYPGFDAPVAAFWVFYRVGSRNELPGHTGVSHWVEHMMFKGTEKLGLGEIMQRINRNGGEVNAFTSYDYTAYHETLPADRIEIALEIEADRMTGLLVDPAETESERTVILSERQMIMNNPSFVLWDETIGTAFRSHAYRHFVIGTEHDLQTMSRDDLYGYYRRFYAPNNAVVVVAGAFDADAMQQSIAQAFGGIAPSEPVKSAVVAEPIQIGERRVELHRPAPAPEVLMGFHVPGAGTAEVHALELLSAVLSGAGGRMGRSARLPRSLVSTGKARAANGNYLMGIDPFLFLVGATGLPDGDVRELDGLLMEQLELVKTQGLPDAELARAQKQLTTSFHYGSESVTDQAHRIGDAAMYGDAEDFFTYPDKIRAVTSDEVQAVANRYLTVPNRTVGYLVPADRAGGGDGPAPTMAVLRCGLGGFGAPPLKPFERDELESGIVLLTQPQPNDPVVAARIRIEAGSVDDSANRHGLAHVTAQMLLRGSQAHSREAFEDACDELGASIGVGSSREHTEFTVTCLAQDLPACLELVGEALNQPVFDEHQLELTRRETTAAIKQAEDNTMSVADQSAREMLYPPGHPMRHRSLGDVDDLAEITRDDLVGFHASRVAPGRIVAAVVGGFRSTAELAELFSKSFGASARSATNRPALDVAAPQKSGRINAIVAGKEQADLALAFPVRGADVNGFHDLDVADNILGSFGTMGRIGESVREKQGLAYYAYSGITPRRSQSLWFSRAGVDPANFDRAIESILGVLRTAIESGVTPEELDGTRQLMTGRLALAMQTNSGIANLLQTIEELDLGLDYVERYPTLLATVTLESTRAAIAASLDPDRLQIAVAGPPPPS
jgi:zinc protease